MGENMYFVAASIWNNEKQDLSLEGFVRRGTLEEAKQYLEDKRQGKKDEIKLYKLVEVDA